MVTRPGTDILGSCKPGCTVAGGHAPGCPHGPVRGEATVRVEPDTRKPLRCRLGWHKYDHVGDGGCIRPGCPHNWITAMHEDTRELTGRMPVIGSGEHEARGQFMAMLGPDYQLTFECDRDGDRMTIRGPRGAFVVEGERLAHRWIR